VSGTGGRSTTPPRRLTTVRRSVAISGTNAVVGAPGTSTSQASPILQFRRGRLDAEYCDGRARVTDPPRRCDNSLPGRDLGTTRCRATARAVTRRHLLYSLVGGAGRQALQATERRSNRPAEVTNTNSVLGAISAPTRLGPRSNVNREQLTFYSLVGGPGRHTGRTSGEINALQYYDNFGYSVAISGTTGRRSNGHELSTGYFYSLVASVDAQHPRAEPWRSNRPCRGVL